MSRRRSLLLLVLVAGAFIAGMAWLFRLRLGQGDVFPAYSTMRADPLGTRALFEALEELPEIRVERSLQPLRKLAERPARTIILAGMERRSWANFSAEEGNALDQAALTGSRVVVVFKAERMNAYPGEYDAESPRDGGQQSEKTGGVKKKKVDGEKTEADGKTPAKGKISPRNDESETGVKLSDLFENWKRRWGFELASRWIMDREEGALKNAGAAEELPAKVPWKSDRYFKLTRGSDWQVVYTRGLSPVLMEMRRGKGSVVLATDTYFLSNEAMQKSRETSLLAWLVGKNSRVVFIESHLGIEEEVGIARLARRYGLAGAFFVLLLLAALFVWERVALFVPPAPDISETLLAYHPSAGLEALLRRALPPGQLTETCIAEWARTARASDVDKARAALALVPAKASPADHYNAVVRALKRR
jgi:hypothetical protein